MGTARPLLAPLATLAVAVLVAAILGQAADRLAQPQVPSTGSSGAERFTQIQDANILSRLLIWRDTIPVILERPLLGHGLGNFQDSFVAYEGEDLKSLMEPVGVDKAHNEFLQVAATTGFVGLAAYLWIFAAYFRNVYHRGGWTLIALSGGILAYIIQLQTIFTTLTTGVTFWAVLGVSAAVMRLPDRQPQRKAIPTE